MARKKSTRLMIILAIVSAMVMLLAQLSTAFAGDSFYFDEILVSTDSAGSVDDVDFGPEDIIGYDEYEDEWFMYFDGSEYGLQQGKHDVEAFVAPEPYYDERMIFISFYQNKVMVPDVGRVFGQDIIQFTEDITGTYGYEWFFDGSDVGLTKVSEKIDALDIDFYDDDGCELFLFISTLGNYSIPAKFSGTGSKLTGDGSDILLFCATNLGEATAGFWYPFFDGQEEGMPKNYMDSIANVDEYDHEFFFTTPGAFDLDDAFGGHSEIYYFECYCGFEDTDFEAAEYGLDEKVDGLHIWFDI